MKEVSYWCHKCNMRHNACISTNQSLTVGKGDIVKETQCKQCGAKIKINIRND
jgi:hypothetical protein